MLTLAMAGIFLGYMVLYAAVKDEAPWDELVAAFGGAREGPTLLSKVKTAVSPITSKNVSGLNLQTWGSATLIPGALDAYKRASARVGGPIPLTGSYRPEATQARLYASNPDRYAPPGESFHVKGQAIDVSMPVSKAVNDALIAESWCRPRADEPWHYSWGGCG